MSRNVRAFKAAALLPLSSEERAGVRASNSPIHSAATAPSNTKVRQGVADGVDGLDEQRMGFFKAFD